MTVRPAKASATRRPLRLGLALALVLLVRGAAWADDKTDEYRLTVFPAHPIGGNDKWISASYFGYVKNPDAETTTSYLGTGTIWRFQPWGELWFYLIGTKTAADVGEDSKELRPLAGLKNIVHRKDTFVVFNIARMEDRIIDKEDSGTKAHLRLRDRFGAEFALNRAQPFKPRTLYGLADVEGFYRFDQDRSDLARLRAGLGYVMSPRLRVEFIYHAEFKAPEGEPFDWTGNIYRLNFKISTKVGILGHLTGLDDGE